jgi:hypothetical protein
METLKARVPDDQISWTYTMLLHDSEDGGPARIEQSSEPEETNLGSRLVEWLETCQGSWEIRSEEGKVRSYVHFESEEDYVRYCFDWIR